MHYVRFLKTPKVHVDLSNIQLKAVVTVTTDLGETFYPDALELIFALRSPEQDGDIYLRKRQTWPSGSRSLAVTFEVSRQQIDWPACLQVSVRGVKPTGLLSPFVDVWSSPINPAKGHFDSGRRVERRFTALNERPICLLEDAGDSIARHLWDGSQALANHIDESISLPDVKTLPLLEYVLTSATYRRLHVLELGCGCGTVGISLAQSIPDANVVLTDLPDVAELVNANIARARPAIASTLRFEPLDWLDPVLPAALATRKHDLIVVSECTYNTDTLAPLVATLTRLLAASPKAVVAVATKTRHASEAAFFDLARAAGLVAEGALRLPLPGDPGHGYADTARDVGLHVFRGRDHRMSLSPRNASDEDVPVVAAAGDARAAAGAERERARVRAR